MPLIISLVIAFFIYKGCSSKDVSEHEEPTFASYKEDSPHPKECHVSNPYSQGTGHYAGFEWAERRSAKSCGGNSNSFIEGCEEYLAQMNCN